MCTSSLVTLCMFYLIGIIGAGFIHVGSLCKKEGSSEACEKFEGTGFVYIITYIGTFLDLVVRLCFGIILHSKT